jgi:septum site-determining protein MinC
MPVQIRIADLIAQAPDSIEKPAYAEKASVKNNQIIIEPIER